MLTTIASRPDLVKLNAMHLSHVKFSKQILKLNTGADVTSLEYVVVAHDSVF
jgi:hypothetical protein